jgi:hypothetical protein
LIPSYSSDALISMHLTSSPAWSTSLWWQKLHSHAYTCATVCSFVSFTHYLIYFRRWSAKKIRLWRCLLHRSFPSHSW